MCPTSSDETVQNLASGRCELGVFIRFRARNRNQAAPSQLLERGLRSLRWNPSTPRQLEWRDAGLSLDLNQQPGRERTERLSSPCHDLLDMRALHVAVGER